MHPRQAGWFMNLGTLGLAAYVLVGTVGSAIGFAIHTIPSVDDWDPGPGPGADVSARHPLPARRAADLDGLAERNLFGARRETLAAADRTVAASEGPCSLRGRLRATIVSPEVPEWSVAVLVDPTAKEPRVYFANTPINDDAVLTTISYRSVLIRKNGRTERCSLDDDPVDAAQATASAMTAPSALATTTVHYTVERRFVDGCLANLGVCARQARMVPTDDGLQVVAIKPTGVFDRVGLRNGDIILRVNGDAISDFDRRIDAFARLRDASQIVVELRRGSRVMTMTYAIE